MKKQAMVVDYKYCTYCHACEVSCRNEKKLPLDEWGIKVVEVGPRQFDGKWYWNYLPVPSSLCDLCEERSNEGNEPACVLHCLAKCIEIVPIEETGKRLAELGETAVVYAL